MDSPEQTSSGSESPSKSQFDELDAGKDKRSMPELTVRVLKYVVFGLATLIIPILYMLLFFRLETLKKKGGMAARPDSVLLGIKDTQDKLLKTHVEILALLQKPGSATTTIEWKGTPRIDVAINNPPKERDDDGPVGVTPDIIRLLYGEVRPYRLIEWCNSITKNDMIRHISDSLQRARKEIGEVSKLAEDIRSDEYGTREVLNEYKTVLSDLRRLPRPNTNPDSVAFARRIKDMEQRIDRIGDSLKILDAKLSGLKLKEASLKHWIALNECLTMLEQRFNRITILCENHKGLNSKYRTFFQNVEEVISGKSLKRANLTDFYNRLIVAREEYRLNYSTTRQQLEGLEQDLQSLCTKDDKVWWALPAVVPLQDL